MAQGRLTTFAVGAVILVGGVAVEVISRPPVAAAVLDWIVGAAFVVASVREKSGLNRGVGLLTAAAWFLASLPAAPSGVVHDASSLAVLAYRGPLLHWLALHARVVPRPALQRPLVVTGYVVALTGTVASAFGTCAVAAGLSATMYLASRREGLPADMRRAYSRPAPVLALLAVLWAVSAAGMLPATANQVLMATCQVAVAWHLSRQVGAAAVTEAVGSLVLELGPTSRPASPLSAALARALADSDLQVLSYQRETGWTDELGQSVPDPVTADGGRPLTVVDAPAGGRVVLAHGPNCSGDTELARAAASAAALALDSFRVEAQVRQQALEVRRSAIRLMTVDDAERQALAARLRLGPIARLERVGVTLRRRAGHQLAPLIAELDRAIAELNQLAFGLNPVAVSMHALPAALQELIAGSGLPAGLELRGDVTALPPDTGALVYFLAAECLTNITRYTSASSVSVSVRVERKVTVEISDNGLGGAILVAGRGLQGLADRVAVARGTFEIASPPGGPTRISATIPVERQ